MIETTRIAAELTGKTAGIMAEKGPGSDAGYDERRLVERCLAGDSDAFEPIVRRYRTRLTGLAYHLLGQSDRAEDAVQEAFFRGYKSLSLFERDRDLGVWLQRILVNYCLDVQRRERRSRSLLDLRRGDATEGADTDKLTGHLLRAALDALPARQRAAVVLRDMSGYPAAAVAEILGISQSTVRVHLSHGRRKLRKLYLKLEKQYKEWLS